MSVGKCDHKQLGYNVYIFIMILIIDIYYKIFWKEVKMPLFMLPGELNK